MYPFQGKDFRFPLPRVAFAALSDPGLIYVSPLGKSTLNTYYEPKNVIRIGFLLDRGDLAEFEKQSGRFFGFLFFGRGELGDEAAQGFIHIDKDFVPFQLGFRELSLGHGFHIRQVDRVAQHLQNALGF